MLLADLQKPSPELIKRWADALNANGFRQDMTDIDTFANCALAAAYSGKNNLGIFALGDVGRGKTQFLKALFAIQSKVCKRRTVFYSMKNPEHQEYLNYSKNYEWVKGLLEKNVIIDDFGSEAPENNYGVKSEPILDFILWYIESGKGILSISSNLTGSKLLDRYTARVDAIREHLIIANFKGKNLREWLVISG